MNEKELAVEFLAWFLQDNFDWQFVASDMYRKDETGQNISGEELFEIFLDWYKQNPRFKYV